MDQSIAAAIRASPQLERARREREVARIAAARERPRRGAGLSAAALGSATLQGPKITFPERDEEATVLPRQRLKLELRVEQTLFQAGKSLAIVRATATESAADLTLRRAEQDLALAVTRAYLGALTARAAAEAASRGAAQARAALRRIEALLDAGRATPGERLQADAERAEAERAEAERAERAALRAVQVADAALNRLLGQPLDAPVSLEAPPSVTEAVPLQDAAVAAALRARPDVGALREQVRTAEVGEDLARLARRPVVTAGGGYALQTPSAFVARSSWNASVGVTFPIWDGGRTRLEAAEARARAASARSGLAELESGIAVQVMQSRFAVLDARDRGETTRRATAAAAELLRAAEQRLGLGRATALEVITARSTHRRAEMEEARARYDLHLAWAELRHAMGRLQ